MFTDEEVVGLINKYGFVTTLSFIAYGDIDLDEVNMLSLGLFSKFFAIAEKETPYVVIVDYITETQARAMNCFQGTKITFIFGGELAHEEAMVHLIGEGIEYLRFKFDFLGKGKCDYGV